MIACEDAEAILVKVVDGIATYRCSECGEEYNQLWHGGAPFKEGDKVRIISLTDVDTKEPDNDDFGLIGRTATVAEPALNDYYDCTIQMDEPLNELGDRLKGYGMPPVLAMLYRDLEVVQ